VATPSSRISTKLAAPRGIARDITMKRIRPKFDDWSTFRGRELQIKRSSQSIVGTLLGLASSVVAGNSDAISQAWLLRTDQGDMEFLPDRWEIYDLEG
jgi:hypothetical protein